MLDSLLPRQRLELWSDDESFCGFLFDRGLGSTFGMVGEEPRSRRAIGRGVEVRIEGMAEEGSGLRASLEGHRLFRVLDPASAVGCWQPTSTAAEPSTPGSPGLAPPTSIPSGSGAARGSDAPRAQFTWAPAVFADPHPSTAVPVQPPAERGLFQPQAETQVEWLDMAAALPKPSEHAELLWQAMAPQVEQWLAKVRAGRLEQVPGQLDLVLDDLGPCPPPSRPSDLALWLAALLNPIPPLKLNAPDVRPGVLLAPSADEQLAVVYAGLARSLLALEER